MSSRSGVGLDIGSSGVRAAEVSVNRGRLVIERRGQVALPAGAVQDGEVLEPGTVAHALKQLWRSAKFSSRRVVLGVANPKVIVRQVELPWLPPAEMKAALGFQVQDFIPMPVEAAELDYLPLEEFQGANGTRMLRGLLVAASKDMINANIAAVTKAGLTPTMVDLTSFAILRCMGRSDSLGVQSSAESEVLVDVGARVTNIVVHAHGRPRFVRILLAGGQDITEALAQRLGVDLSEAERIKQELPPDTATSAEPAALAADTAIASFVDEIRGSLNYYVATSSGPGPERLVLTGGGARMPGLVERLSLATRLPVSVGSPIEQFKLGKVGLTEEQLSYVAPLAAVPVGLALGGLS
ncbi:MAG: type IV pilus assembly protein PilM [Actinomycetes bacterium]